MLISIVITSLIILNCSNSRKREVSHSIRHFYGKKILIRDSVYFDINSRYYNRNNNEYLIVSYYDTDFCSECTIDGLLKWQNELDSTFNRSYAPIFLLFHSPIDVFFEIENKLSENGFQYPIYYDSGGFFINDNPCLPEDRFLHTFLIDDKNEVLLSGVPIRNKKLWQLYVNTFFRK